MRKKMTLFLLAALWALAGCGMKPDVSPPPEPAPALETHMPVPEPAQEPPDGEAAQSKPEGVAAQYVGAWRDAEDGASGGQCRMEIAFVEERYAIDIYWDGGAGENTHWQFTGVYDEIWEGIDYIGTRYEETTLEDGTVERNAVLEDATGLVYLDEDGAALWEDTFEHKGDGLRFLREG